MKKLVDRTEEKLKLAEELGMSEWQRVTKDKIEVKKDIENLTSMNFTPTTEATVRKKLIKRVWHGLFPRETWGEYDKSPFFMSTLIPMAVVAVFGFIGTSIGVAEGEYGYGAFLWATFWTILTGLLSAGIYSLTRFKKCTVQYRRLENWTDNIPYGAMLAVKEAKEKGLYNFEIYYPCKQEERIMKDPIITAKTWAGNMVEVFYWDDGKIYE